MRPSILATLVLVSASVLVSAQTAPPLTLEKTVSLSGVEGGFDHLAFDPQSRRVYSTAEDQGVVKVFMLDSGILIKTVDGFKSPHSVLALPGAPSVIVADSGASRSQMLDAKTLQKVKSLPLVLGANCLLYDAANHRAFITGGGDRVKMKTSTLTAIDPATGGVTKNVVVDALHLQPMALDTSTHRLFVSIADHDSIGVFDSNSLRMIAEWKIAPEVHHHAPIAFDAKHHRLFIAIDHPGNLLVLDTETGKQVASTPLPDDADDMDFDPATGRLYIPTGEGFLVVLDATLPDNLKQLAKVPTGKEAATGLLLPSEHKYLLAVPISDTVKTAEIRIYKTR